MESIHKAIQMGSLALYPTEYHPYFYTAVGYDKDCIFCTTHHQTIIKSSIWRVSMACYWCHLSTRYEYYELVNI